MDLIPVAWVIPHGGFDLGDLPSQMHSRGFHVRPHVLNSSAREGADLRVLQADLFRDMRSLREEYAADARATLIIARTLEQQAAVLEFVQENGDVTLGLQPIDLVAFRLRRLRNHATNLARIDYLDRYDTLTGLLNRRQFPLSVDAIISSSAPGSTSALVLLDVDGFKAINDQFGHAAGDVALVEVARLIQDGASPRDRFARYGGDEFLLLISRYDAQTAVADVDTILMHLAQHRFESGSCAFSLTASAGMTFVNPEVSLEDLVRRADDASYAAKGEGRNRLVVYEQWRADLDADNKDPSVETFKNVARVLNERITAAITRFGARLVESARHDANTDPLTGLPNRRYFDAKFSREIERANTHGRSLALAMMDLDFFGNVNRNFGFLTGDEVLRAFVGLATAHVRSLDWIARVGGEEFCLVMPDAGIEIGLQVAERIRAAVEGANIQSPNQQRVPLTVSIGVVQMLPLETPAGCMERANKAVREAKATGRNRVVGLQEHPANEPGVVNPPRVLVVNDNPVTNLIEEMVRHLGYSVTTASNGAEAVASCLQDPPDAVVMDIQMPVMDGIEASAELLRLHKAGRLPFIGVIATSAAMDQHMAKACAAVGMLETLCKPLDIRTLGDAVEGAIRTSRERRSPGGPGHGA